MKYYDYKSTYYSLKGVNKNQNEDNYLTIEGHGYNLYAIFDGVGSAENSLKATELAKAFITDKHHLYLGQQTRLNELMNACNQYILATNTAEPYTTYCAAVTQSDETKRIVLSSLGDSRIYLVSKQFIEQMTTDDKLEYANIVTKCLGMSNLNKEDFRQNTIQITDENLLLCTDGFYQFLEEDRMRFFHILNKKNINSIKEELVSLVADKNKDDATFVLIR